MGLLTDPGAGRGKLTQLLVTYHGKLYSLFYVVGLVWFGLLASNHFNAATYFSENALLPGLVQGEYNQDQTAKQYLNELKDEADRYPNGIPYSWLLAKFRQLNMETYTHNFTLSYPLGRGAEFKGKNVYAILRAPRSASTEALVLNVPYRPPSSVFLPTNPSIALMLSLAKFFRYQKYWAKDIIFLVSEHEQLGVQAWLEAYHQETCGRAGILNHGDMMGRGGAIQAAVILELHAERIRAIDVKVEGLNGQLPNLDLVNLVHRMCAKEGVRHTFKNRENFNSHNMYKEWMHSFKTLMAMVATQATGIPNGNHGLFHRFGIEAVTLEGFEKKAGHGPSAVYYQMGRILEGIFRSLNNLLERFHQSYFFYLLPATDRYVSIGMYMPPLGLMCGGLLIKAFALWLKLQDDPCKEVKSTNDAKKSIDQEHTDNFQDDDNKENSVDKDVLKKVEMSGITDMNSLGDSQNLNVVTIGMAVLAVHVVGVLLQSAAQPFSQLYNDANMLTELSVYTGFGVSSLTLLSVPYFVSRYIGITFESVSLLNVIALIELATLLLGISMHNFSLALFGAVTYVPPALWISPLKNRFSRGMQWIWWLLLNPFLLFSITVCLYAIFMFPELTLSAQFSRGIASAQRALVFSIVDSYVYGNWVYNVATSILVPVWLLFWIVIHCDPPKIGHV